MFLYPTQCIVTFSCTLKSVCLQNKSCVEVSVTTLTLVVLINGVFCDCSF